MRYYFMPYDPANAGIVFTRNEYSQFGFNGHGTKKNQKSMRDDMAAGISSTPVWYAPKITELKYCRNRTDEVFIRGHGMPGVDSIEGGRGGERVEAATIVERLKKSGLKKSFGGLISCYSCHSGESGPASVDGSGQPFALTMKNELRRRGYKSCSIIGYLGAIDSFEKMGSAGKGIYAREFRGGTMAEIGTLAQATVKFH